MIFACAVLVIIKFGNLHHQIQCSPMLKLVEYSTEKLEKAAALSELAKRTRSYSAHSTKVALVVPKTRRDDLRWLRDYLQTQQVKAPQLAGSHTNRMPMVRTDNTPFIYTMDKRPEKELLIPHSSRGREASAYLSFIVDLYDNLPEYSIFVHADPDQWHNDLFGPQTSNTLPNLRLEAVNAMGYLNLRCTNNPGCPAHINTNSPSQEDIDSNDARANFPRIYKDIFGEDAHVPDTIGGICCAQFAVSRARIQERPKSDYIRMLNWVDEKSIPFVDNYGVGWVFETLWHVVFGMEGVQ